MTRERKLAIEMWIQIKKQLPEWLDRFGPRYVGNTITESKRAFCAKHYLHWKHNCYLCHYMPACDYCPLQSCQGRYDDPYYKLMASTSTLRERLEACDKIIKALGGTI